MRQTVFLERRLKLNWSKSSSPIFDKIKKWTELIIITFFWDQNKCVRDYYPPTYIE